jgi:hypothetical protein
VDKARDILDHDQTRNVSKLSSCLLWKEKEIILTKWANFNEIGVFEIRNVGLVVRSDKLFGSFYLQED